MAITVSCGECFAEFQVGDQHAGKRGKCRSCGAPVTVPQAGQPSGDEWDNWDAAADNTPQGYGHGGGRPSAKAKPAGKSRVGLWIGLAVGLIVVVGGVVMATMFLGGNDNDEPKEDETKRVKQLVHELGIDGKDNQAVEELRKIGSPAIPHLKEALQHTNWRVRFRAVETLSNMPGSRELTPDLLAIANDKNEGVRTNVFKSLSWIGREDPKVAALFAKHKNDENERIRKIVARFQPRRPSPPSKTDVKPPTPPPKPQLSTAATTWSKYGPVLDFIISPNNRWVVTARGQVVIVWDLQTGKKLRVLEGQKQVTEFSFSADSKLVAAANTSPRTKTIVVWNVETGEMVRRITVGDATRDVLSGDGKTVCAWGQEKIEFTDLATGKKRPIAQRGRIAWNPTNATFVLSHVDQGDGLLEIWDSKTLTRLTRVKGPVQARMKHAQFSLDGSTFVGAHRQGDVYTTFVFDRELNLIKRIEEKFDSPRRYGVFGDFSVSPKGKTRASVRYYRIGSSSAARRVVAVCDVAEGKWKPIGQRPDDKIQMASETTIALIDRGQLSFYDVTTGKRTSPPKPVSN